MANNAKVIQIFNGIAVNGTIAQTQPFSNADFLFYLTPNLNPGEGYEIAAALVIEIKEIQTIGGLSFPVLYGYKEINLDDELLSDTEELIVLPEEVTETGCDCYLCLVPDKDIYLEIYAVSCKTTEADRFDQVIQEIKTCCAENLVIEDAIYKLLGEVALSTGGTLLGLPLLPALPGLLSLSAAGAAIAAELPLLLVGL